MRTTLTIDDDVLHLAKSISAAKSVSVGKAISDLARLGHRSARSTQFRSGFAVFEIGKKTDSFGLSDVERVMDQEDEETNGNNFE